MLLIDGAKIGRIFEMGKYFGDFFCLAFYLRRLAGKEREVEGFEVWQLVIVRNLAQRLAYGSVPRDFEVAVDFCIGVFEKHRLVFSLTFF